MAKSDIVARLTESMNIAAARQEEWEKAHPGEVRQICPYCKGTGLLMSIYDYNGEKHTIADRYKPGMYEYFSPCICTKGNAPKKMQADKNFASVPSLYADANLDNFRLDIYKDIQHRQEASFCKTNATFYIGHFEEMEEKGIGFYIWSASRGSGKSRLASTISNELTARGIRNKYASANAILSEIQASWNDKNISEASIIRNYESPRLLIIDDIGARSGQAWIDEKFFMILDKRYQEQKPTIITSNYGIQGLPFKDTRIIDRLSDVDRFVVLKMPNVTLRTESRTGTQSAYYEVVNKYREGNKNG